MKRGLKKKVALSLLLSTVMLFTLGTGIASAKTVSPNGTDTWTYYASFNIIKMKKSSHSNYSSWNDHTASAQVGDGEKVRVSAKPRTYAKAVAYGSGTAYAWYNNTSTYGF